MFTKQPNPKTASLPSLDENQVRARIDQEDNLINHRVSWLIGSQSFLLSAFVSLHSNPSFFVIDSSIPAAYIQWKALLTYVLLVAGLVISISMTFGVLAAIYASSAWRDRLLPSENRLLASGARLACFGGLAPLLPGFAFGTIWATLAVIAWPLIWINLNWFSLVVPPLGAILALLLWAFNQFGGSTSK